MATHRPVDEDDALLSIAFASRVEFVGGPRDGRLEDRSDLPEVIKSGGGEYRRSVRCAEDGAMRYVWHDPAASNRRT
jgi:hypothetical protein